MSALKFEPTPARPETIFIDPAARAAVIDPDNLVLLDSSPSFFGFNKVSRYHGRSITDPEQQVVRQDPLLDEFGQVYFSFSIKGADASLPIASYDKLQPNKVRINGMLEASTFERCQQASRHLREHGVLTEWPIFHAEPDHFPENKVGIDDFREQLYDNYLEFQQVKLRPENTGMIGDSFGKIGLVGLGLTEVEFSVMYRAMLSNARIPDLHYLQAEGLYSDSLIRELENAIKSLQQRNVTDFKAYEELMALDPIGERDQKKYLGEILPAIMGENLARFHNSQCVHSFPHSGNWTLAGELVDLDTVECSELYEDDIPFVDEDSRFNDLSTTLVALDSLVSYTDSDAYGVYHLFCDAYVSARHQSTNTTDDDRILMEAILRPVDYSQYPEVPMVAIIDDAEITATILSTVHNLEEDLGFTSLDSQTSIFDMLSGRVLASLELEITVQVITFVNEVLPRTDKHQQDQVARILIARQKMKLLQGQVTQALWQNIDHIYSRLKDKISRDTS